MIAYVAQCISRLGRTNSMRMRSALRVECRPVFAFQTKICMCHHIYHMQDDYSGWSCTPDSRARCSGLAPCLHNERSNINLQASAPGLPAAVTGFECPSCICNRNCTGSSGASAWPGYPWVVEVDKLGGTLGLW